MASNLVQTIEDRIRAGYGTNEYNYENALNRLRSLGRDTFQYHVENLIEIAVDINNVSDYEGDLDDVVSLLCPSLYRIRL